MTELTCILELMCELSLTGKKPERRWMCEQHICPLTGKVIYRLLSIDFMHSCTTSWT